MGRRYELCSQYGLYVMDEANVETHGFDPLQNNNEVRPAPRGASVQPSRSALQPLRRQVSWQWAQVTRDI